MTCRTRQLLGSSLMTVRSPSARLSLTSCLSMVSSTEKLLRAARRMAWSVLWMPWSRRGRRCLKVFFSPMIWAIRWMQDRRAHRTRPDYLVRCWRVSLKEGQVAGEWQLSRVE